MVKNDGGRKVFRLEVYGPVEVLSETGSTSMYVVDQAFIADIRAEITATPARQVQRSCLHPSYCALLTVW